MASAPPGTDASTKLAGHRWTTRLALRGMPIPARPVGDGFAGPDLLDEAACLTRPRSVVRDGTSDRRACSSVGPSRQWLRSLAVLVEERLELCPFRDEVGDQHGCCSGPGTGSRRAAGPRPDAADQGASRARSAGRRPEPGNVGLRRSGCCPFRRCRSVGLGQNRLGACVESAGSKVGAGGCADSHAWSAAFR